MDLRNRLGLYGSYFLGMAGIGFTLPFGVALEPGIGLVFGKDPVKVLPFRTCNQVGCVVLVPFDDAMSKAIAANDDGRLMYSGLDGKAVPVPFTLKGYKTARSVYEHNNSRRASWFWRLWS